jgi:hypothetical protein
MSEAPDKPPEILGALPRTRPQRRSNKRGPPPLDERSIPKAVEAVGSGKRQPSARRSAAVVAGQRQPVTEHSGRPTPTRRERLQPSSSPPVSPSPRRTGLMRTLVQAGAELAEIGLSVTARAVRDTVARLPRP